MQVGCFIKIIMTRPSVQTPVPVLTDRIGKIEIDFTCDESINYQFELFKFYKKRKRKS
jgi:hypothetical protein